MANTHERLHAVVSGRVHGVNYRAATQSQAQRLGLTGWVRNRPDGSVEVMAEGPRVALEQLAAFLHRGPPAAWVAAVQTGWEAARDEFRSFEVRW